jgi:hypothetical protein
VTEREAQYPMDLQDGRRRECPALSRFASALLGLCVERKEFVRLEPRQSDVSKTRNEMVPDDLLVSLGGSDRRSLPCGLTSRVKPLKSLKPIPGISLWREHMENFVETGSEAFRGSLQPVG